MNHTTFVRSTRTPRVKFYLEKRNLVKGDPETLIDNNAPIRFSVSYGGRYMSSTGFRIDSNKWDEENQRVKPSHTHAAVINKQLKDLRTELEAICYDAWDRNELLTPEYISEKLVKHQKSAKGLFYYFDQFIEQGKQKWQNGTVTKLTTIKNHLEEFQTTKGVTVEYDRLNDSFFEKFMDFYFEDKVFINTYVRRNIRFLQQFLIWSTENGYNRNQDFRKWKLETGNKKEKTSENIALTRTEFFQIYYHTSTSESMERAKDYLILACATGLRFSDIANLKKTDIDYSNKSIHTTTIKTGDDIKIPFNDFSYEILEKYRHTPNYNKNGIEMAFPAISNQKTNTALKDLAREAKINAPVTLISYKRNKRIEEVKAKHELISTHIGRKTFITFNVEMGVKSEVTMNLTGHKSHRTMESYYGISPEQREQAMSLFSKKKLQSKINIAEIKKLSEINQN